MEDQGYSSLLEKGEEALEASRYEEAIPAHKEAIRIKPDDARAHFNLGRAYLEMGNRVGAEDQHQILKELDP